MFGGSPANDGSWPWLCNHAQDPKQNSFTEIIPLFWINVGAHSTNGWGAASRMALPVGPTRGFGYRGMTLVVSYMRLR
jgi:hypothetical protein